jgi:hypothetical protein
MTSIINILTTSEEITVFTTDDLSQNPTSKDLFLPIYPTIPSTPSVSVDIGMDVIAVQIARTPEYDSNNYCFFCSIDDGLSFTSCRYPCFYLPASGELMNLTIYATNVESVDSSFSNTVCIPERPTIYSIAVGDQLLACRIGNSSEEDTSYNYFYTLDGRLTCFPCQSYPVFDISAGLCNGVVYDVQVFACTFDGQPGQLSEVVSATPTPTSEKVPPNLQLSSRNETNTTLNVTFGSQDLVGKPSIITINVEGVPTYYCNLTWDDNGGVTASEPISL